MFNPKKVIYAKVTYVDIAGIEGTRSRGDCPAATQSTYPDGRLYPVVRCLRMRPSPHPLGSLDPQRDIAVMESEFILSRPDAVERKLERLNEERRKGARDKASLEREVTLLNGCTRP